MGYCMATRATPVTEAEKDEPNVQGQVIHVDGVGAVTAYLRIEQVDDMTDAPAEEIETVQLRVPVKAEMETVETDAEGDPIKNKDGTDKIKVEEVLRYEDLEIDLSPASFTKLSEALEPFRVKARPAERRISAPASTRSATRGGSTALADWNRRAKIWLGKNRPELEINEQTRGRLSADNIALYVRMNPGDPRPKKLID